MPYLNNSSKGIGMNNFKKLGKKRDCYNYKKHSFFWGGGLSPNTNINPSGGCALVMWMCVSGTHFQTFFSV